MLGRKVNVTRRSYLAEVSGLGKESFRCTSQSLSKTSSGYSHPRGGVPGGIRTRDMLLRRSPGLSAVFM